ncbi:MAG: DUF3365 domain-containing protein [Methylococcales bacterium]|nr:DUF3365 domain-containing protein [Methylococcales bacterium]
MNLNSFFINSLLLIALSVFLFVTAPAPLPLAAKNKSATVDINQVFMMLEAENDAARAIWTKEIVKAGKQAGLKFDEDWRENNVEAGPLPALFLRETARNMERNPLRLSLFLGSDFPISSANKFEDSQLANFMLLKTSSNPQFFLQQDTALYTAMFPDMAISQVCVDCHNDHKDTPKTDWKLNDMMGATTWMYPKQKISLEECLALLNLLRDSIKTAYARYIDKVATFQNPPEIGSKWPKEGYFLPDVNEFIATVKNKASVLTLNSLLEHSKSKPEKVAVL